MYQIRTKETYNFGNDWGLFVDMESNYIDIKNEEFIKKNNFKLNKRLNYNKLCQAIVDEYDFYLENCNNKKNNNFKSSGKKINVVKLTSATCFSLLLTYMIFYVL